jgi:membrane carboxypeptidase/penicillin-binding protein
VPSLALGSGLVTPLDLTAAYAVFPNGGYRVRPRAIVTVVDGDGRRVRDVHVERERVLSPQVAFQVVSMLEEVVDRGTGSGVRAAGVRGAVGGKTGTTNDYRDAWFVGFSSSVVAGVWVGFDQPQTIRSGASGGRAAVPIWAEFMRRTATQLPRPAFEAPPGLRHEALCALSHQRPVDGCPTYVEHFKDGDEVPARLCEIHQGSLSERAQRALAEVFGRLFASILRERPSRRAPQ